MATTIRCDDKALLVAYLYDEVTAEERGLVDAHLAACAACRRELAELRELRVDLAAWTPPEPAPGFRIVREDPPRAPAAWWRAPAWGFAWAAAAVVVVAVGAALAALDIRYDREGLTIRTGWRRAAPPEVRAVAGAAEWRAALDALESRLRQLEAAQPAAATGQAAPGPTRAVSAAAVDEAALLRRVAALIDQSEARQRRELALRMAELVRDLDAQRRADWVRLQQAFGRLEQLTGASVMQQRDLWNYVMRVAQRDQR
jgi:hypothetical protein